MVFDTESKEALEKERILLGLFWKLGRIETENFNFQGISLHRHSLEQDLTMKRIVKYNNSLEIIKGVNAPREFYLPTEKFEISVNEEFYQLVKETEKNVHEISKKGVFISSYSLPNIFSLIEDLNGFNEKYKRYHIENGSIVMDKERLFTRIIEDTYKWNKLGFKRV